MLNINNAYIFINSECPENNGARSGMAWQGEVWLGLLGFGMAFLSNISSMFERNYFYKINLKRGILL